MACDIVFFIVSHVVALSIIDLSDFTAIFNLKYCGRFNSYTNSIQEFYIYLTYVKKIQTEVIYRFFFQFFYNECVSILMEKYPWCWKKGSLQTLLRWANFVGCVFKTCYLTTWHCHNLALSQPVIVTTWDCHNLALPQPGKGVFNTWNCYNLTIRHSTFIRVIKIRLFIF